MEDGRFVANSTGSQRSVSTPTAPERTAHAGRPPKARTSRR
jgi:hypothetical protein